MMKSDPNIETLRWMIDFLNDDLEGMTAREIKRRAKETRHFLCEQWPDFPFITTTIQTVKGKTERVKFRGMHTWYPTWPDEYPWKEALQGLQAHMKMIMDRYVLFEGAYLDISALKPDGTPYPTQRKHGRGDGFFPVQTSVIIYKGPLGISHAYTLPDMVNYDHRVESLDKLAEMIFYVLLNGLPNDCIKKCKECGRYFLQLSRKVKVFCSQQCASRFLARDYRAKHPEEYRTKQREIMKKRYRAAVLGK